MPDAVSGSLSRRQRSTNLGIDPELNARRFRPDIEDYARPLDRSEITESEVERASHANGFFIFVAVASRLKTAVCGHAKRRICYESKRSSDGALAGLRRKKKIKKCLDFPFPQNPGRTPNGRRSTPGKLLIYKEKKCRHKNLTDNARASAGVSGANAPANKIAVREAGDSCVQKPLSGKEKSRLARAAGLAVRSMVALRRRAT